MNASIPTADSATVAARHQAQRLAQLTAQAREIILTRQDPHTGLLPASTAITVHGDYTHAWVRDNVYSILAIWALSLAHRQRQPAVAAELALRVVALMRGLLGAMMRQAHKVERFKHTQHALDALHAKYDTRSGDPVVGDAEWGHLQIDATALFLLQLAQMSAGGLRIVQQPAEVQFVQNLVHYLARAYRTPDYGIWERGHKRNEGRAEINASSVGMAKAALEAAQGLDLLPGLAPRILVQADDIAHCRNTLAGLLPRESESKETDGALLSIVGFPAFAVDDHALAERTRAEVVGQLQGRYGCKRFLRDGHQTVLEDHSRLHYEPGELQHFEHIESEWPLFFTYLLLDAALRGHTPEAAAEAAAEAADYRQRLEDLMQERDGQRLLPELYFVPREAVEAERAAPHSQTRCANDNLPLVWAQSLYLVGVLLQEGMLRPEQLDPLGRRHARQPGAQPAAPVCVQVALLAADPLVQARLAAHGIRAQTLAEVAPVQVRYADELDAALDALGSEPSLGLSGRPRQRPGSLATSRVYSQGGVPVLFLPALFNRRGFYLALDNRLLVEELETELRYLRTHWREPGRPLMGLLVSEAMLHALGAEVLLAALRQLGTPPEQALPAGPLQLPPASVCSGPLQALLEHSPPYALDWLPAWPEHTTALARSQEAVPDLNWEEAATRALSPTRAAALERGHSQEALQRLLQRSRNPYEQIEVLDLLARHHGLEAPTGQGMTLRQMAEALYARACHQRRWGVIRRAAGLLDIHDETLEDAVAQIVVRQKQVSIGRAYDAQAILSLPLGNAELFARLRAYGGEDARGRVLIQEIVLLLGMLIKADAKLFKGTLTLRPWYLLLLITARLALEHDISQAEALDHLLDCSPQALLGRLREVIASEREISRDLLRLQSLPRSRSADAMVMVQLRPEHDPSLPEDVPDWEAWRELTGTLTRVSADFHQQVWRLLSQCAGLVIGDQLDARNRLDSALARADTTPGERSFALQVEELLNKIHAPEYRQLTLEALRALSQLCQVNPELVLGGWLVVDVLIGTAVRLGWLERLREAGQSTAIDHNEHRAQAWKDFYASPPHRVANLVMAAAAYLMRPEPPEAAATAPTDGADTPALPAPTPAQELACSALPDAATVAAATAAAATATPATPPAAPELAPTPSTPAAAEPRPELPAESAAVPDAPLTP